MEAALTHEDLGRLVERFYAKARRDPLIGPVFERAVEDWDEHLARLTDFWSSVMLTSGRYKGNPFGAHSPLKLQPEFFTRWLQLWDEVTTELFQPEIAWALQQKARRIGESLQQGLFFRADVA
jgi:hemoglobin